MLDGFGAMLRGITAIPNDHPTAGTILTGLVSIALMIGGFSTLFGTTNYNSYDYSCQCYVQQQYDHGTLVGNSLLLFVPCLILLALVIYAAYDTRGFQQWSSSHLGHAVARWTGPLILVAAIFLLFISIVLAVFITCAVLSGLANS